MLSAEAHGIVDRKLTAEFADRNALVGEQTRRIREEMVARGVLTSGMTVGRQRRLFQGEVRVRGRLAWDAYRELLIAVPSDLESTDADEIKSIIEGWVERSAETLQPLLSREYRVADRVDRDRSEDELRDETQRTMAELAADIDLFFRAAGAQGSSPERLSLHFHGNVGAVQTGAGANATIHQLTVNQRATLEMAFSRVEQELSRSSEVDDQLTEELLDMVREGRGELDAENPNMSKLKGILLGVSSTIGTIASLRPAYDLVRGALRLLGVP